MLEFASSRWNGDRWRLWSFLTGVIMIPLAALLAGIVALIAGERVVPLILLFLITAILAGSVVGSGIIDSLSSQLNRGGLARESTDQVDKALGKTADKIEDDEKEHQDRKTVRAGLFVIAPIVAFVYFMTIV